MGGPVTPGSTGISKIVAVAGNLRWIHAYATVDEAVYDPHPNSFIDARFYTVDGRQLTPTLNGTVLIGLSANSAVPNVAAVQLVLNAAIVQIRTKVDGSTLSDAMKQAARAELNALQTQSLSQRYDSLHAKPLGHIASASFLTQISGGSQIQHQNGWLHNLFGH
jgi:hypothetical protein